MVSCDDYTPADCEAFCAGDYEIIELEIGDDGAMETCWCTKVLSRRQCQSTGPDL